MSRYAFILLAVAMCGCATSAKPVPVARGPSAYAAPPSAGKPERPSALVSVGEPSAGALKQVASVGKSYCGSVISRIAEGDQGKPACKKALSRASVVYTEFCKGDEYLGFSGFNGVESVVVSTHFLEAASTRFSSAMFACKHSAADVASVTADQARAYRERFDREFKTLVGGGMTDAEFSKVRSAWVGYAAAYLKYLESAAGN